MIRVRRHAHRLHRTSGCSYTSGRGHMALSPLRHDPGRQSSVLGMFPPPRRLRQLPQLPSSRGGTPWLLLRRTRPGRRCRVTRSGPAGRHRCATRPYEGLFRGLTLPTDQTDAEPVAPATRGRDATSATRIWALPVSPTTPRPSLTPESLGSENPARGRGQRARRRVLAPGTGGRSIRARQGYPAHGRTARCRGRPT